MKDVQDFQIEWRVLLAVTISGLIYNLGLLVGPWFEGQDGDIYFTQNDCFDGTYDFYIIVCNRTDKPDKREECRENDKGETTDNKKQYGTGESDRAVGTKRDSEGNCTYHYRRVLVGDCRSIRKIHI